MSLLFCPGIVHSLRRREMAAASLRKLSGAVNWEAVSSRKYSSVSFKQWILASSRSVLSC